MLIEDNNVLVKEQNSQASTNYWRDCFARATKISWLGQTAASLCWIASVFVYGLESTGDVLQLCAASAWLIANIAHVFDTRAA